MSLIPLIQKDLTLIARRKRWFAARGVIVGLLLLITAPLFLILWFSVREGQPASSSARGLFLTFTWTQIGLIALTAPALGAASLSDTRTDASLDLLRLASISRPSLAFAKLFGSSLWPIILACSQIPFLALWSLWGGVTGTEMLAAVALTATLAVALIALGLGAGTAIPSPGLAFATSYGLAIVYCIFIPIGFNALPGDWGVRLHPINALHAILVQKPTASSWPYSLLAVLALSVVCGATGAVFLLFRDIAKRAGTALGRDRKSRKVWDRSVMWRELRSSGGRRTALFVRVSWVLSAVVTAASILTHGDVKDFATVITFALVPPVLFAVLGASSIAAEKEAGTILPLILAPHGSTRVVVGKALGILIRGVPAFIGPLLIVVLEGFDDEYLVGWLVMFFGSLHLGVVGLLCSVLFRRVPLAVAGAFIGGAFQAAYAVVFFIFLGMLGLALIAWVTPASFDRLVDQEVMWVVITCIGFSLVTIFNVYLSSALFEPMARLDR